MIRAGFDVPNNRAINEAIDAVWRSIATLPLRGERVRKSVVVMFCARKWNVRFTTIWQMSMTDRHKREVTASVMEEWNVRMRG